MFDKIRHQLEGVAARPRGMSELAMREFEAISAYLAATGTPHRVTSTLRPQSKGSYHALGCAVDFAEPKPSRNAPGLLAIFAAFGPVESRLTELIYSGAPYSIKNGKRTSVAYGNKALLASHWDHVHVAVNPGVFLSVPTVTKAEAMARVLDAVAAHRRPGFGPEQFAIIARDGSMWCFNGAPYCSAYNAHSHLWGGSSPNTNRVAVDFEWDPDGWGYTQYMDDGAHYHWRAEGH